MAFARRFRQTDGNACPYLTLTHFCSANDLAIACTVRSISSPSSKSMTTRRLAGDAGDQFAALDDLQVVEAEAVAGRRDEVVVGRVDAAPSRMVRKPCSVGRSDGDDRAGISLKRSWSKTIEPFEPKIWSWMRPLRPQAERLTSKRAGDAVFEADEARGDVVGLDGAAAAARHLPVGIGLCHVAHDALDAAEQVQKSATADGRRNRRARRSRTSPRASRRTARRGRP